MILGRHFNELAAQHKLKGMHQKGAVRNGVDPLRPKNSKTHTFTSPKDSLRSNPYSTQPPAQLLRQVSVLAVQLVFVILSL